MNINEILNQLAKEPSILTKMHILTDHLHNNDLITVLHYTLNPAIKFNIKKIPEYELNGKNADVGLVYECLKALHNRQYIGNKATQYLKDTLASCDKDSALLLEKIIQRDLRCGVNVSIVNKVWKNLIPEYPYMRCSLLKQVKLKNWPLTRGVYSQLKADGSFANVNLIDGEVQILTRAGSEYPLTYFKELVNAIITNFNNNTQTHGELLIKRNGVILPREISNGILNSLQKSGTLDEGDTVYYAVWDQIPLSEAIPGNKYQMPYSERFNNLTIQVNAANTTCVEIIETVICYTIDDIIEHLEKQLHAGLEGTIIKHPDGIWEDTTSKNQVKLKLSADVDLVIIGFKPGNGKNVKTFGSIMCQSSDGLLEVNISGLTDKLRKDIHDRRDELLSTIITVTANSIMKPSKSNAKYSLFLPRWCDFRPDKIEADDLSHIQLTFTSAIDCMRTQLT
jgi:DNA ligase-1